MRMFLTLITAVGILMGAYVLTFGIPALATALFGVEVENSDAADALRGDALGAGRGRRGSTSTTVVTAPLTMMPYESTLNAVGSAEALRSVSVLSDAAGEVIEAHLPSNGEIEAGDVLVTLDARTETLNLEIAQAELEQARDTVNRYARLQANGNSTITAVTLSDAVVAQRLAQANVGLMEVALDDRTIRAPISGRLGLSDVEVGDVLAAGAEIVTIDDADALLVSFELPERAIGMLSDVDTVLASTPSFAGRVFDGNIVAFDSRLDSVTRSVTVEARIENPGGVLWPGMTFEVRIIHESAPMAAVPSTAITWSREGSKVWIHADGIAETVPVTILFRRDELVWIDADVAEGTLVVTEGAQKLREGARIATVGDDSPKSSRDGEEDGSGAPGRSPAADANSETEQSQAPT